jgi:hypothetical protein
LLCSNQARQGNSGEREHGMGEKGNLTSDELAAGAASAVGGGAVIAGAGTQVTAVFEEAGEALKDKIIDKGADAGIAATTEKWKGRRDNGEDSGDEQASPSS